MSKKLRTVREITPEEIFLDSSNLPRRDEPQFEGRVVRPIGSQPILGVGLAFIAIALIFSARAFELAIVHGETYAEVSRENRLDHSLVFAPRGLIYDRTEKELAWNERQSATSTVSATSSPEAHTAGASASYPLRRYIEDPGFSHVLGFVRYPRADMNGIWWREETSGISGVELAFDDLLAGQNGAVMVETNALGEKREQSIVESAVGGGDIALSIDADVQTKLHSYLLQHAEARGFVGGAGVIMDVHSGELLALVSFPEYSNQKFTDGDASAVEAASESPRTPLLNRAVSGLYAPGSIVKPIFAAAALAEGIISPEKEIRSTGAITVPNPYDPTKPSVFRDWAVHGLVNMRDALAVSSDEYFYTIGGGYGTQPGLGIRRLDEYARRFGLGSTAGIALLGEEAGVIPTPEWKAEVFGPDDPWRIGNTYHTAIGQYGFQITPLQAVRFVAAVANGGTLLRPQLFAGAAPDGSPVGVSDEYLRVVREGMRLAVTSPRETATVKILQMPGLAIAAKTGTAQIGAKNEWIHSWSVGFWPADAPRYAYAVVLEQAPAGTRSGAAPALRPFFEWLVLNKPEYLD